MKRFVGGLASALSIALGAQLVLAQGQGQAHAPITIPDSSVEHPGERGLAAHTNHVIKGRPNFVGAAPAGETPASIASIYNISGQLAGAGTIVIVDAFHYPTALDDFNVFSSTFGLPTEPSTNPLSPSNTVFQVVYADGKRPRPNCGWAQEAALDIEWAHAMAPNAKIVLVEAATNSFADLFRAVDVGTALPGAVAMSLSWGGSEFSSEASNDSHFPGSNGVLYFASSGDTGGVTIYPGVSPRVISAGGTRINRDSSGAFVSETGWSGSGGGASKYESRPAYQDVIQSIVGARRGVPDYSFDADPQTGVSVYDSTSCQNVSGWLVFGGTSVSSPALAGIATSAGGNIGTAAELSLLYGSVSNGGQSINLANFRDILSGTAGSFTAKAGWDFVTGIGSTNSMAGK